MAPLPGIERINYINIMMKEGSANLDIFKKRTKTAFQAVTISVTKILTSHIENIC